MGRIQVLDDVLANQIAAGEVVERPASAAKEILENALDAGATAITIEISSGGIERLRVVDNGCGMSPEDARLALKRHATSKLNSFEQLQRIATLGFRGEAIPSIASVSRFQIRTRERGAVGATRVIVEGGEIVDVVEAPGPVGTEILVEDLFYNVPARRKFLKKPATEATHIHEAVQRMALCNPGVAFRFIKDGRTSIDLPQHKTLSARVGALFGPSVAEPLRPVDVDGAFALSGLIGPPSAARGTARHYHTFINGRFISDKVVRNAIQAAYGQRLERGRHPFVILHLRVPPEAIDVNVHPAKTEVRFVDSGVIHRLVARAIDEVLTANPWRVEARIEETGFQLTAPGAEAPKRGSWRAHRPSSAPQAAPQARDEGEAREAQPASGPVDVPPIPEFPNLADSPGVEAHRKRIFDVMDRLMKRRRADGGEASPGAGPMIPAQREGGSSWAPAARLEPTHSPLPPLSPEEIEGTAPLRASPQMEEPRREAHTVPLEEAQPAPEPPEGPRIGTHPELDSLPFGALTPLTEIDGVLICAAEDGLVGVDVKAAAARVTYQRLREGPRSIPFGRPTTFDLSAAAAKAFEGQRAALKALGLEVEHFGGRTYALKSMPVGLDPSGAPALVAGLLEGKHEDLAWSCAKRMAERRAHTPDLLSQLGAVTIKPRQGGAYAFALTAAELRGMLR